MPSSIDGIKIALCAETKYYSMELRLNNVNRINTADIKVNGLTVIVGPNNSGKSTIGRTLYSIVKAIANANFASEEDNDDRLRKHVNSMYSRIRGLRRNDSLNKLIEMFPRNSTAFIQQIHKAADASAFVHEKEKLIKDLDIVPRQKSLLLEDVKNIIICLTDNENLAAKLRTELQFLIESEFLNTFCSVESDKTSVELLSEGSQKLTFEARNNSIVEVRCADNKFVEDATYVESPLYIHLIEAIIRGSAYRETEIPYPTLFSMMVPSHIKDMAEKIMSAARHPIDHKDESSMDLKDVIGGSFTYDDAVHHIVFRSGKHQYSPLNVASGIKCFGIVDLLEKANFIGPNRLLIWDEPENHLHPEWQVLFAEKLVTLAKEGVPVVVTTHSPYFLQAIRFYTAESSLGSYVNYYTPETDDNGLSMVKEVTNDLTPVFEKLTRPLDSIMDLNDYDIR